MNRTHQTILRVIQIALVLFFIYRMYKFVESVLLLRTKPKEMVFDANEKTGVVQRIVATCLSGEVSANKDKK